MVLSVASQLPCVGVNPGAVRTPLPTSIMEPELTDGSAMEVRVSENPPTDQIGVTGRVPAGLTLMGDATVSIEPAGMTEKSPLVLTTNEGPKPLARSGPNFSAVARVKSLTTLFAASTGR